MKKRIPAAALSLALCAALTLPAAALEVDDARTLLKQYYVGSLPSAAFQAQTVDELLSALGDPYTVYYTAQEYEDFLADVNGESLVGIGVSIQSTYVDGFEILSVLPGSPALETGLQPGDKIIAVDGVALTPQDSPSGRIGGAEGEAVTVTVRTPAGEVRDFTMVRRVVQIPIVTYEGRNSAGYINCSSFGGSTYDNVRQALTALDAGSAAWVMDLRSNPGGTSNAAAETASLFLGRAEMVYFRDGSGQYYKTASTPLSVDMTNKPLIILTGARSASAAELFSAAIRDHGAGIAIGQRTYGKGVAQKIYDRDTHPGLFDGDALKITTYRFFSPNGAANHTIGVLPTLLVPQDKAEDVAMLLSAPVPEHSLRQVRLELCGHDFYLDTAMAQEQPEVLTLLLEALPPDSALFYGTGSQYWREITAAELAAQFGAAYTSPAFSDLEGHPWQREINTLKVYGLVSGSSDGLFHPDEGLTRAQLCAMLATVLDLPAAKNAPAFSDVDPSAWYAGAVSAMAANGFMGGTGNGAFSPDSTLTRAELCTVYSAVAAWCSMDGHELSQRDLYAQEWAKFYDYPEWAQTPARNLDELGLEVDPNAPNDVITRGEAAGQLCTLLENLNILWNK